MRFVWRNLADNAHAAVKKKAESRIHAVTLRAMIAIVMAQYDLSLRGSEINLRCEYLLNFSTF